MTDYCDPRLTWDTPPDLARVRRYRETPPPTETVERWDVYEGATTRRTWDRLQHRRPVLRRLPWRVA